MEADRITPLEDVHTENESVPPRRFDQMTVWLAVGTLVFVLATAWLRFRAPSAPEPPSLGSTLPSLRLIDLKTREPLLLLGLRGKIVWVVFWSADSDSGTAMLPRLEATWRQLRSNQRFVLVAVAVDSENPDRVSQVLADAHISLPAYLATPETTRRFGIDGADPPLHLLIDAEGRIGSLVRGAGQGTILRLSAQVRDWLDEMDPLGPTRYAVLPSDAPESIQQHRPTVLKPLPG